MHVLCKENTSEIFKKSSIADKVHTVAFPHTLNPYEQRESYFQILKKLKQLREQNFDIVYNMRPHKKDRLYMNLIKGKYLQPLEHNLYRENIHVLRRNDIEMGQVFGYEPDTSIDYVRLEGLPDIQNTPVTGNIILFHTGGSSMKKPDNKTIVGIINKLTESGLDIITVRSPYDQQDDIALTVSSISEWATLCGRSRGVISFDTGPMHIACAHAKKTFAIFGATSPDYFGPQGENTTYYRPDCNITFIPGMKHSEDFQQCFKNMDIDLLTRKITDFFKKGVL